MADDTPEIDLEALDAYLMSDASPDDCMLVSDLDGFLTGVVVGPDPVSVSEWLSAIWGGEEPKFESEQQEQAILGTIMARHAEIGATMKNDPWSFEPIFYDGPDGTLIVTDWAAGFLEATKLRPQAWGPLFQDREAKILLVPLVILGGAEDFFEHHSSSYEKEFYAAAPDVLQACVVGIHEFWRDQQADRRKANPRRKRGERR